MKIGILTQQLHNNYGGLLQNYALQQVLKDIGHDVETIDWEYKTPSYIQTLWNLRQRFYHIIDKSVVLPHYTPSARETIVISHHTHHFIKKYISVCPQKANSLSNFGEIGRTQKYEAYVVGSDQVWRPSYNSFQSAMFLSFAEDVHVKRVAYAASFGTASWEFSPAMTEVCSRLAKKFDLITVREKSGVELCRDYLGVEAMHVLDPTMLLDKEVYIRVVEAEDEPASSGTLFHYILDPSVEKGDFVASFASKQGLIPFTIMPKFPAGNRTKWDVKNRIEDCIYPSVTSWLRGFMDAKMVVVDSFHGAVFSIIFNKPFWVLANAKRGNARFESLLGMFGLEDRMISTDTMSEHFDWNKEIDWVKVNDIRQKEVVRCKSLLEEALKK